MSAPSTQDCQSAVAITRVPRSRSSRSAKALRLSCAARMDADLVEVEEVVEETHVPVGRAPRPDMAKDFCILSGEVFGANRGHRAGAHVGDAARIENRLRCAGARIEQDEDPELRGKPSL